MASRLLRLTSGLIAGILASLSPGGITDAQAQDDPQWSAACAANTVDAYENYLRQNPTGPYAADAFRAIVQISRGFPGSCTAGAAVFQAQGAVSEIY